MENPNQRINDTEPLWQPSPRIARRISDRQLYIWAAILIPLIVLAGFARTYYLKGLLGGPDSKQKRMGKRVVAETLRGTLSPKTTLFHNWTDRVHQAFTNKMERILLAQMLQCTRGAI